MMGRSMKGRCSRHTAGSAVAIALLAICGSLGREAAAEAFSGHPTPAGFGFASFSASFTTGTGEPATQAGSHPNLKIAFELNEVHEGEPRILGGEARNLTVNLPPGLAANATAVPQCPRQLLDGSVGGGPGAEFACPANTQVGVDSFALYDGAEFVNSPVYNMVPPPGVPAEFAFNLDEAEVFIDGNVRSGGDYGLIGHSANIPQRGVLRNAITLFGEPGGVPFLTLPTSCGGPLALTAEADTWEEPRASAQAEAQMPAITGCERLTHFDPTISAAPDTGAADTATGLTVDVHAPQGLNPEGLATSGIEDTSVTLPAGVALNPGQAAGLEACQPAQENLGGAEAESEAEDGPPSCPPGSAVGTVEIETPLLKDPLKGAVYVLQSNPPDLQLLLAASADGVNLKLVGNVHLNEATGQLTTTFNGNTGSEEGTPDLPFTEFRLSFDSGARAAIDTPTVCGTYTTTASFTPWSGPLIADALATSSFEIESGPGTAQCAYPEPFTPTLVGGSTSAAAGGFTSFSALLQRGDGQQRVSRLQIKAPPGLLGMISRVPLCPEPQASTGQCPSASAVGHAVVESGPGSYPLVLPEPGQPPAPIYLTGPYAGAPFGLTVVVPIVAGPFDLGTEVVRSKIEVDPRTAQITVTTDPLPRIIKGIPTDLRTVSAVIDRPGFVFNPTNCDPQALAGTATSTEGATAQLASPFQVGSCEALKFKPSFTASTSGKTSRERGASLSTKIVYPSTAPGNSQATGEANIASAKVELPKQLPSRLTTLHKACLASVFEANPAGCPAASAVGHAKVVSAVLPVPLTGPAYFVSHGSEAFPSLIVVLQGDGVTIDLVGATLIKKGITSTTFKAAPDAPFSSFELSLPEGAFSALAAHGNLCKANLNMPTVLVAQDGAEIHQSTKVAVTGCPKRKRSKRAPSVPRR
jgi:hypothetical protein